MNIIIMLIINIIIFNSVKIFTLSDYNLCCCINNEVVQSGSAGVLSNLRCPHWTECEGTGDHVSTSRDIH